MPADKKNARDMEEKWFMVAVQVPSRMTAEEVSRELRTCISFGSPFVTILCNVPAPQPAQVV